ncbi:hypothetical protein IMZ48_17870 [Candidatus Bathyarchaeota archaeon]|nr:hypothetical protein [Candidatus Bathyarchaeota archaeon]
MGKVKTRMVVSRRGSVAGMIAPPAFSVVRVENGPYLGQRGGTMAGMPRLEHGWSAGEEWQAERLAGRDQAKPNGEDRNLERFT